MPDKLDMKVTVIDYGMGNLRSVMNKVQDMVTEAVLSSDAKDILDADALVLPGVGHFAQGMQNLQEFGLLEPLRQRVEVDKVPIMGICLGMQLFTKSSEEGHVEGLGWIDAETKKFDAAAIDHPYFKVPHMGWNTLEAMKAHPSLENVSDNEELYFCHSFYVDCHDEEAILTRSRYGMDFTSAFQKGNILGFQFHPEKSHDVGAELMRGFFASVAATVITR